jgi:putative alpha-1,2-mannosidase
MKLENGNTFTINAKDNTYDSHYIESLKLNGFNYNKTWIDYNDILNGGTLNFNMSKTPNKNFGIDNSSRPFSLSHDGK